MAGAVTAVAIVVPMLDEAPVLPRLLRCLAALDPAPAEIVVVDGGSSDASVAVARAGGLTVIEGPRGRAAQCNAGIAATSAPVVCVLHVDTWLPDDAIDVIRRTLADPRFNLGGFTAILSGPEKVRWATSFHNWIKTWYAPLLFALIYSCVAGGCCSATKRPAERKPKRRVRCRPRPCRCRIGHRTTGPSRSGRSRCAKLPIGNRPATGYCLRRLPGQGEPRDCCRRRSNVQWSFVLAGPVAS